jgi:hypothetical protein
MNKVVFHTDGTGLWSDVSKSVRITNIVIGYIDDEFTAGRHPTFGELRVYFDTRTWDTYEDGLIYTDKKFLRELRAFLNTHGLVGRDVTYSEQGMQGGDYVSCDVGGPFLKSWGEKFGLSWDAIVRKQEQEFKARWG